MLRRFDQETLLRASQEPQLLARLIEDSAGYVLVKLRQAGLSPTLEQLMAHPSEHVLSFILDHFEPDEEQRKELAPFFIRESGNPRLAKGKWDGERIEAALLAGIPLPASVSIPYDLLLRHPKQVSAQGEFGEYEYEEILERSAKALSARELMSLDRGFLEENHWLFEVCCAHYTAPGFKELSLACAQPRLLKGLSRPLESFKSWPFEKGDEEFLHALLEAHVATHYERTSWSDVEQLNGASKLMGPMDFFRRHNPRDIDMLGTEEVQEHKAEIQRAWLAVAASEPHGIVNELLGIESSPEAFREIVDSSFASRAMEINESHDMFGSMWRDDSQSRQRHWWMKKVALEAIVAEPERLASLVGWGHAMDWAREVATQWRDHAEKSDGECTNFCKAVVGAMMPLAVPTTSPFFEELGQSAARFSMGTLLSAVVDWAKAHPSLNALWMLAVADGAHRGSSAGARKPREEGTFKADAVLTELAQKIDSKKAKMVLASTGFSLPSRNLTGLAVEDGAPGLYPDSDFLDVDYAGYEEFSGSLQQSLALVDDSFADKMIKAGKHAPEAIMGALLREGSTLSLAKLAQLCVADPERVLAMPHFAPHLLSHKDADKILGSSALAARATWDDVEDKLAHSALARAKWLGAKRAWLEFEQTRESKLINDKIEKAGGVRNMCPSMPAAKPWGWEWESAQSVKEDARDAQEKRERGSPEGMALHRIFLQEARGAREAEERLGLSMAGLTHESLEAGLDLLEKAGRLADLSAARRAAEGPVSGHDWGGRVCRAMRELARGGDLLKKLRGGGPEERAARSIATQWLTGSRYEKDLVMDINAGSPKANRELAIELLSSSRDYPERIFRLFESKAATHFSKEFAVEFFPALVPYRYELRPHRLRQVGAEGEGTVAGVYSNDQLVKIWEAMEAEGGFFWVEDSNSDYAGFIDANFEGYPWRYLAMLDVAKRHPKLYCILGHSVAEESCAGDLRDSAEPGWILGPGGEPVRLRDELRMMFKTNACDWDVALQGMEEILDEVSMRDGDPGFNSALAMTAVDQLLWGSAFEDMFGKMGQSTAMNDVHTRKLLAILCAKAPLRVYQTKGIGGIESLADWFSRDGGSVFGEDAIERFVFPPRAHTAAHYSMDGRFKDYARGVGMGLAHWMLAENRSEDARFLDWWLRESKFRSEELDFSRGLKAAVGWSFEGRIAEFFESDPEVASAMRAVFDRMSIQDSVADPSVRRKKAARI